MRVAVYIHPRQFSPSCPRLRGRDYSMVKTLVTLFLTPIITLTLTESFFIVTQ